MAVGVFGFLTVESDGFQFSWAPDLTKKSVVAGHFPAILCAPRFKAGKNGLWLRVKRSRHLGVGAGHNHIKPIPCSAGCLEKSGF